MTSPSHKSRRQELRLWFEYLRISFRLPDLKENLQRSANFYASWGDIQKVKFDDWWKEHKNLFGETAAQVVTQVVPHPNVIHLAVPINVPISRTLRQVRGIVLFKQKQLLDARGRNPNAVKTRSIGQGQFEPTPGVEIRGQTLYEVLVILTAWIELDRPAVNSAFCAEVLRRLKSRPRSKWVPYLLQIAPQKDKNGDLRFSEDQVRQIRRYLKRGQEICRSVSMGEFPGNSRLS